jgi:hypothetical protein
VLEYLFPKKRLDIDQLQDKEELMKRLDRLGVSPIRGGNKLPSLITKSAPVDSIFTPRANPKDSQVLGTRFSKKQQFSSRFPEEPSTPSFEDSVALC